MKKVCPRHPNVLMSPFVSAKAHGYYCPVCAAEKRALTNEPSGCRFRIAWVGYCGEPIAEREMCAKHARLKCAGCGEQATQECPSASSLVCGAPICDKCQHTWGGHGRL